MSTPNTPHVTPEEQYGLYGQDLDDFLSMVAAEQNKKTDLTAWHAAKLGKLALIPTEDIYDHQDYYA